MRLGTAAMRAACARVGDPQDAFPSVLVAGTNGKGSVSAMVERAARAAGLRTGLYTSPHLCRFAERIRLDGEPLADDALAGMLGRALEAAELSFFEAATLAAFLAFRDAKVELAIVEVGIGARLDATNVIARPRASAITRVALDHTDKLGRTHREIAWEKAHVARAGAPLVVGPLDPEALAAAARIAEETGAVLVRADEDAEARAAATAAPLAMAGEPQRDNAAVAYALGRAAGVAPGPLGEGVRAAVWPGRMERIDTPEGPVLLDGAHNPDGAAALARALAPTPPRAVVFGALADKDAGPMLDLVAPLAPHRVYVAPKGRAATPPAVLAARHPGELADGAADAIARARRAAGRDALVVVCGSLYLVGEARAHLLGIPTDPPVAL